MYYIGCHLSKQHLEYSLNEIKKLGGNCVQLFLSNPRKMDIIKNKDVTLLKNVLDKYNFKVIIHSPYIINIAKYYDNAPWLIYLYNELRIANTLNALGVVVHIGKSLELNKKKALDNMVKCLQFLIQKIITDQLNVKILLETSAGQGTELLVSENNSLDKLAVFYNQFSIREQEILNICVDTCHIYAGGYDIREKKQVDNFWSDFHSKIGIDKLALIHLNNSKNDYNSHKDRHECINSGTINIKSFKRFVLYSIKYNIPIILETPNNCFYKEIPWIYSIYKKFNKNNVKHID